MRRIRIGNLISILFGSCLVAGGIYAYQQMGRTLEYAREVSAVVTDVVYESVNKKGRIHPVVRFRSSEGKEIIGTSQKHHNVRTGDSVQIVYDIRKPEELEVGTLAQVQRRRRLIAFIAIAIGMASILAGAALHLGLLRGLTSRE